MYVFSVCLYAHLMYFHVLFMFIRAFVHFGAYLDPSLLSEDAGLLVRGGRPPVEDRIFHSSRCLPRAHGGIAVTADAGPCKSVQDVQGPASAVMAMRKREMDNWEFG